MTWAATLDRMIKRVRDTFPASVIYDPDGVAVPLTGIFDEAFSEITPSEAGPVSTVSTVLTVVLTDLAPLVPRSHDVLELGGVRYEVTQVQPDGSGCARLYLTEGE